MDENYTELSEFDRPTYVEFHEWSYQDSSSLAEEVKGKSPRWCIVIGYYAMHDITKLYLGKIHNKRISGERIHAKTINTLREVIADPVTKKKIIGALRKAREKYELFSEDDEKIIVDILKHAKNERGKQQYYQSRTFSASVFEESMKKQAEDFLEKTVKPFLEFMEEMIKNA